MVVILSFIQQFSGMAVIQKYVVEIFDSIFPSSHPDGPTITYPNGTCIEGSPTSDMAYISAIILGLVRLIATIVASVLLTK